jgi:hypothetical protein
MPSVFVNDIERLGFEAIEQAAANFPGVVHRWANGLGAEVPTRRFSIKATPYGFTVVLGPTKAWPDGLAVNVTGTRTVFGAYEVARVERRKQERAKAKQ